MGLHITRPVPGACRCNRPAARQQQQGCLATTCRLRDRSQKAAVEFSKTLCLGQYVRRVRCRSGGSCATTVAKAERQLTAALVAAPEHQRDECLKSCHPLPLARPGRRRREGESLPPGAVPAGCPVSPIRKHGQLYAPRKHRCQRVGNMETQNILLDKCKKASKATTDMALADALGVGRAAVSKYRKGLSHPDAVVCARIAELSGEPLARVLGIVGEERAISREEKQVWRRLATAAAICFVALLPFTASAGTTLTGSPDSHYAKYERLGSCSRPP